MLLSFGLAPFLGENFFPSVDSGQILMYVRAPTGTRIEETARLCDLVEQAIRQIIPPDQLDNIVDNIGLPYSGINRPTLSRKSSISGCRRPSMCRSSAPIVRLTMPMPPIC